MPKKKTELEKCGRGVFGNLMSCIATYFQKCPNPLKLACAQQSGPDAAEWVKILKREVVEERQLKIVEWV